MKYCTNHHANPDNAEFCHECGEKLQTVTPVTENIKICSNPNCKAANPVNAEFCHECGKSLIAKTSPDNVGKSDSDLDGIGLIIVVGFAVVIVVGSFLSIIGSIWEMLQLLWLIIS